MPPFKKRFSGRGGGGRGGGGGDNYRGGRGGGGRGRSHFQNNNHSNNYHNNNPNHRNRGGRGGHAGAPTVSRGVLHNLLNLVFEKNLNVFFNEESGVLILDNLSSLPDLSSAESSINFNNDTFASALAETLKEKYGNKIRSISANHNRINRLAVFLNGLKNSGLHEGITALSFSNNHIRELNFLNALKPFTQLSELILNDNPISPTTQDEQALRFQKTIRQQIPSITLLNGIYLQKEPLTLPNPCRVHLEGEALSLIQSVEQQLFQTQIGSLEGLYSDRAYYGYSYAAYPFDKAIPTRAIFNTEQLSKSLRDAMRNDLLNWRNCQQNSNLEKTLVNKAEIAYQHSKVVAQVKKLSSTSAVRLEYLLNPTANVTMVSGQMCAITVHSKVCLRWAAGQTLTNDTSTLPFVSCFMDRTFLLYNDGNGFRITNDMVFVRPDSLVVYEDNTPSDALFFADQYDHLQRLQRTFLPTVSLEVLKELALKLMTDRDVIGAGMALLEKVPAEQLPSYLGRLESLFS